MKYEFHYNVDYVREHNPRLMEIGLSGGFGCERAQMIKAVEGGDLVKAEKRFWALIVQSLVEAKLEAEVIGIGTFEELIECWFEHTINEDPSSELSHFVRRLGGSGGPWLELYTNFKDKHSLGNEGGS